MSNLQDDEKVILITGASSGIGKKCAEHLAQRGHQVFGTSRSAPFPPDLEGFGSITMLQMDVDDTESVERGVDFILERAGRLDVVVNNAGFGIAGAVEDTSIEEARAQFETNFFGVLRVCKAVLPSMRERRSGTIVNISSIGGLVGVPYTGLYGATKFAIEGMTETMRMELHRFGINVVLIEPGDIQTSFPANRRRVAAAEDSVYREEFERTLQIIEEDERNGTPPERVAHLLGRVIQHPSPRLRYRVGSLPEKAAAALKSVIPSRLLEWIVMKTYGLR